MKLVHPRAKNLSELLQLWEHYGHTGDPRYPRLVALPATASREEMEAILGYTYWTRVVCSECGKEQKVTVQFCDDPNDEYDCMDFCRECLGKAMALVKSHEGK